MEGVRKKPRPVLQATTLPCLDNYVGRENYSRQFSGSQVKSVILKKQPRTNADSLEFALRCQCVQSVGKSTVSVF